MNDELKAKEEALKSFRCLPKKIQDQIKGIIDNYNGKETFTAAVMGGQCPNCGSSKTMDCDETSFENVCKGLCLECYIIWCLECGEILKNPERDCEHWEVCKKCEKKEIAYGCEIPIKECEKIESWLMSKHSLSF